MEEETSDRSTSLPRAMGGAFLESAASAAGLFAALAAFGALVDFVKKRKENNLPSETSE